MKVRATNLLGLGVLLLTLPVFAAPPADAGVTRTEVEGFDDWAASNPVSPGTLSCPGGELDFDQSNLPFCDNSTTGRLHIRDGVFWSCVTAPADERFTGIGIFTFSANLDADYTGAVWGTWKIVPTDDCKKLGPYPEEQVMSAMRSWYGTWNGQRQFYSDLGFPVWIGDLKIVGKGSGGNIDGLHFKGMEWITTYTPFPLPYELIPGLDPSVAEGYVSGTIKE